ncbi:hypothetical protein JCM16303_004011 [Sporobolomyces ruberrimus]
MSDPHTSTAPKSESPDALSRLVDSLSLNNPNDSSLPLTSTSTSAPPKNTSPPANAATRPPEVVTTDPYLPTPSQSTFVLFQPECTKHRYIRNHHDISEIVERPQRIRAVKAGVAAAWSKHERNTEGIEKWTPPSEFNTGEDDLGELMGSLSIGNSGEKQKGKMKEIKGKSSPFDILVSHDQLPLSSPALQLIHGVPNYPPDYSTVSSTLLPLPPTTPASPTKDPSSSSSPTRRLSPRKLDSSTLPTTPYPSDSPWPTQLVHLINQIPSTNPPGSTKRSSEIPPHLPQGDLYLCPESDTAIFGALGAVCKGVDLVLGREETGREEEKREGYRNGFVVVRPPGHHCGEANPQGFCFVNNVAVAAAHAHLEHGINRVVILDIDLHHGNGTQEIVWQINERANTILTSLREERELDEAGKKRSSPTRRRKSSSPSKGRRLERDEVEKLEPRPLQVMYSSLHDVLSFPCESGDPSLIASASLQISGPHSQYIQNTHLEPYTSLDDFKERLWPRYWDSLGGKKVEDFLTKTRAKEEETLVLVSAGFDASVHEYSSMSRHGLNVPTWFYTKFSSSILEFATKHSKGRVLFVLEGGYSDKALVSGSMAVLRGLVGGEMGERGEEEESIEDLERIVRVCGLGEKEVAASGKRKGQKDPMRRDDEEWIKRTREIFDHLDDERPTPTTETGSSVNATSLKSKPATTTTVETGNGSRQLRARKVPNYAGLADVSLPPVNAQPATKFFDDSKVALQVTTTEGGGPAASTVAKFGEASLPLPPLPPSIPAPPAVSASSVFFSASPTSSYPPTSNSEGEGNPEPEKKPAIRFVWKQGGIGNGSNGSNGGMGEPRM